MESLIVENVRCFRKRQEVPLAPLTILVGENSTGKSTFLALVRLAWDLAAGRIPLNFNDEPFLFGAFDQIATAKRKRLPQARSFSLGGCFRIHPQGVEENSLACLTSHVTSVNGQPNLATIELSFQDRALGADLDELGGISQLRLNGPSSSSQITMPEGGVAAYFFDFRVSLGSLLGYLAEHPNGREHPSPVTSALQGLLFAPSGLQHRPFAFAPIRSRPLRTYDPIRDTPGPEGTHVPIVLAQTYMGSSALARRLRESVEVFGKASGLFDAVEVRRLGKGSGDPFQLQITIDGLPVNILDVGYGVSQALPILVDCLRGPDGGTFLLQQPEVHLHPRAQAELGSLFGALAQTKRQRFVIETHSDHLVDRVRMDIRDGKTGIRPEDVSLLYFERKNGEVEIAHIQIDAQGNLVDPPPGYRRFFLEEERRFLGGW